jgi:hypothetical protein
MRYYSCRLRVIVKIDAARVIYALALAAYLLLSSHSGTERDRAGLPQAHFETAPFDRAGTSPSRSGKGSKPAYGTRPTAGQTARPGLARPAQKTRL